MDRVKVLLDTDLGSDCDDAGALAVLHHLADGGKAEILAVTHCASAISGAVSVRVINEYYGRADIPVGRYDKSVFLEEPNCVIYTARLMEKYLEENTVPDFESAVRVQRKALVENDNVTLIVIGMLNNIAELLRSEPDDISPLGGAGLVKKSVRNMYVMGGDFADLSHSEWNIMNDIKNAQYITEHFPKPIIYCGFELGENVLTGARLEADEGDNPVKTAYSIFADFAKTESFQRSSWDPITVYCAVEQATPLFGKSENLHISFDDGGRVVLAEGGKDCYLTTDAPIAEICRVIDELLY